MIEMNFQQRESRCGSMEDSRREMTCRNEATIARRRSEAWCSFESWSQMMINHSDCWYSLRHHRLFSNNHSHQHLIRTQLVAAAAVAADWTTIVSPHPPSLSKNQRSRQAGDSKRVSVRPAEQARERDYSIDSNDKR